MINRAPVIISNTFPTIDKYQTERVLASASTTEISIGTCQVIANYLFLLDITLVEKEAEGQLGRRIFLILLR
jgi:hypothetical protein